MKTFYIIISIKKSGNVYFSGYLHDIFGNMPCFDNISHALKMDKKTAEKTLRLLPGKNYELIKVK